jgi:hypothetical protein
MTGEPAIDDLRQFMSEAARTTQPRGHSFAKTLAARTSYG